MLSQRHSIDSEKRIVVDLGRRKDARIQNWGKVRRSGPFINLTVLERLEYLYYLTRLPQGLR